MTTNDMSGRELSRWLREEGEHRVPAHLDEVLERTATMRQRPRWASLERWLPMQTTLRLAPVPRLAGVLVILAILVALAVAIVAVGSRPHLPPPFGVAHNGAQVFSADGDLWRMDPAGGAASTLIGGADKDTDPVFSRSGASFAFLRWDGPDAQALAISSSDGRDIRVVTPPWTNLVNLAWSVDGAQLVVSHATSDGSQVLSVVDATGSLPPRTLDLDGVVPLGFGMVAWAPIDGGTIVFDGHPSRFSDAVAVYAVRPDGSGIHPIVPVVFDGDHYHSGTVAADGSRYMYWNDEPQAGGGPVDGWTHILDLSTGADRQVRFGPFAGEVAALFSPDMTRVVYEQRRRLPGGDWDRRVAVARLDATGAAAPVAFGPVVPSGDQQLPGYAFSPDGTQVLLSHDGTTQAYSVLDGSPVGQPFAAEALPAWQRSGS